jgi:two-component system NarL family sensor kinase
MTPRHKIFLLAIVPLIAALCTIAVAVRYQAMLLTQQQRTSVEAAYISSKEAELRHYVKLATRSIEVIYNSGRQDQAALEEAKRILSELDYGDDGYFFVYDTQGINLVHPRQPELVGRNLWELRDNQGNPTIQKLIARAAAGGGLERYLWEKPSTHKVVPKLGYVTSLPRWGWVLGTGIYLDDIDAVVNKIDAQISKNIHDTMLWISGIAVAGVLIIALSALVLNLSEYRVADTKLKALAQRVVHSQEDERARLSRDLHDGISQWLVSIRLQVEAGIAKLAGVPSQPVVALDALERAAQQLNDVLGEVRRISHDLRPALLDDLGLAAALEHLLGEFARHAQLSIGFHSSGSIDTLPEVQKTVLFRIAQEALTNVKRHAGASHVSMLLIGNPSSVQLAITDDGRGFDMAVVADNPQRGIGLKNMVERLDAVGGKFALTSSGVGTTVTATLPRA